MCRTPFEEFVSEPSYPSSRRPFSAPTTQLRQSELTSSYGLEHWLAYIRPKFEEVHIGNVGMIKLVRRYAVQRV